MMQRMTSDNVWQMGMRQWTLNRAYIGQDGWAWYREQPGREYSVCDLIRGAAETLGVELPVLSDSGLSDLMAEFLRYGEGEPEGVLAILYSALCAQAELRARLSDYEDAGLEPEEVIDRRRGEDMCGGEDGITALPAPPLGSASVYAWLAYRRKLEGGLTHAEA